MATEETKPVEREGFEREEFSEWGRQLLGWTDEDLALESKQYHAGDRYDSAEVQVAWLAWQASTDAALERAAALMRARAEDLGRQGYDEFHKAADAIRALKGRE